MPNQRPDLGRAVSYDDPAEAWDACDIPSGSEGSLQFQVWENPERSAMAAYTVMIWGDLRDYDSAQPVVEYLKRITTGRMVRQGVAQIEVEGQPPVVVHYIEDKWEEVRLPATV